MLKSLLIAKTFQNGSNTKKVEISKFSSTGFSSFDGIFFGKVKFWKQNFIHSSLSYLKHPNKLKAKIFLFAIQLKLYDGIIFSPEIFFQFLKVCIKSTETKLRILFKKYFLKPNIFQQPISDLFIYTIFPNFEGSSFIKFFFEKVQIFEPYFLNYCFWYKFFEIVPLIIRNHPSRF